MNLTLLPKTTNVYRVSIGTFTHPLTLLHSTDELSDLEKQLTEGGANVHDLEKAKKKLQQELEELNLMMEVSHSCDIGRGYINGNRKTKGNWNKNRIQCYVYNWK